MSQIPLDGIGRRIAFYRRLNGWSAQRLADETGDGVSRATLAQLESGRRENLSLRQFLALCVALDVPPGMLLVDPENPYETLPAGGAIAMSEFLSPRGRRPLSFADVATWSAGQREGWNATLRSGWHSRRLLELLVEFETLASDLPLPDGSTEALQTLLTEIDLRRARIAVQLRELGVDIVVAGVADRPLDDPSGQA